jgi:hypothetical protein
VCHGRRYNVTRPSYSASAFRFRSARAAKGLSDFHPKGLGVTIGCNDAGHNGDFGAILSNLLPDVPMVLLGQIMADKGGSEVKSERLQAHRFVMNGG